MTSFSRWAAFATTCWIASIALASPHAQTEAPPAALAHDPHQALGLFTHSDNCIACHNNLVTPDGEDVSIGSTWRSTIMANSARDPYWHASVRRETVDHPSHGAAIQDECARCHMPMAERIDKASGHPVDLFALLPFGHPEAATIPGLAADGISCSVCHQITKDNLGTAASYNGNFSLNPTRPDGVRDIFGPFQIDAGRKRIMRSVTGFEQVEAPHVRESEFCATCHTLNTQAYGPNGEVVGSLPEQMNYPEWKHSAFAGEGRSCQSCHMPVAEGPIRVASVLGDYRDSLARHLFVGGNAFMVRLLNRYRTELGVTALPSELEATAKATINQLQHQTATVTIVPETGATGLTFDVDVVNLTGHKFPTGYPARRAWLHVTVRDGQGRAVFESGAVASSGLIAGNRNDRDKSTFEPHRNEITSADDVQIYEAILGDSTHAPTTGLLTATGYLKDNRLLPRGFDKASADPEIAVHGEAATDDHFVGGRDRVRYRVTSALGDGPWTVDVELRYQPIGYRWAHNLDGYDAPEPQRFVGYYDALSASSSVVVAQDTIKIAASR